MPTILLAQEDAEARENFTDLILDFFPTTKIQPIPSWEDLEPAWASATPVSVLLTDPLWQDQDRADEILGLAEKYPATSCGIFGRHDWSGSLPPGYPLPLLGPDDGLPLRLAELMEDLSGNEFGPYGVFSPAGPHPLGRLYWAKHHQLQRSVQILAPPSGSPLFSKAIRAMARVNHPSVYSLYESVPWGNRTLVALEPVSHPTLLQLRLAGEKLSLLACTRLANSLGSVLSEMESSSVPARLLGEYDYTLSPKGTPRLRNPASYPGQPESSSYDNARHLAGILEPLLADPPSAAPLLEILRHPGSSAFDFLRQTREFERQLAEVREVHVREEELEAVAKTLRARVIRRWAIGLGTAAVVAYLAAFGYTFFRKFLLDAPGELAEAELPVPAGKVELDGQTVEVGAFDLDRHEVTIGDYEKFLAAARENPEWQKWVPTGARSQKTTPASLEPDDWPEILRCARKKEAYREQKISRDTPVFNVDYASAATYAKWKGRRLPTMAEWLRAAGGDTRLPYPWGREADTTSANLGSGRDTSKSKGGNDPFFNAAPGESMPKDKGPFGHFDLGGNLSEWVARPQQMPVTLGGNFTDPEPIPLARARRQDANRRDPPPESRLDVVGFRTAR